MCLWCMFYRCLCMCGNFVGTVETATTGLMHDVISSANQGLEMMVQLHVRECNVRVAVESDM
eukprot:m.278455 g.278455  ORF g.278455 m.278455 type:complete len:62 (+) comp137051_c0_seq1:231-416(+)